MNFKNFLQNHEPTLYKSLLEAFTNQKVSHAYLITGENGTPLKETAYFIAKSLLCLHPSPLADEECSNCSRVEQNIYTDLTFLDGSVASIKKDDVSSVIESFSKTPNETKGVMVYIIHLVENMTTEAVNAILKFLEEPSENCYAILTSQNPSRILPTIISRCETLRLLLLPLKEVIQEAVASGVPEADAEILAHFCNSPELIAIEENTDSFKKAKSALVLALQSLNASPDECLYHFEKEIGELVSSKEGCRYFLDMLSLAYHDFIAYRSKAEISLNSYSSLIAPLAGKIKNPEKGIETILKTRSELELNISPALLLDHMVWELLGGMENG